MTGTDQLDWIKQFSHLQARPDQIFARPGPRPATSGRRPTDSVAVLRYRDEPPHPLGSGLHDALDELRYPQQLAEPPESVLGSLLAAAAGFQRYEPRNNYNAHRGYPSAQCLFPAEVFLCTEGGSWHYDAARHQLRAVGPPVAPADRPATIAPSEPEQATALVVAARPGKLPEYYRELQWSLSLCEAGHLVELLAGLAGALGLHPRLRTGFDDQAVLRMLGALPGDAWLPAAMIELGDRDLELAPSGPRWPVLDDPVLAVDQFGWQAAGAVPAGPVVLRPEAQSPRCEPVRLPAAEPTGTSWARLLFERTSGRANGGFAAAPETMPAATLSAVLGALRDSARERWAAPGAGTGATANGQRLLVVAERVAGLADGLYDFSLSDGGLRLLDSGPKLAEVQRAFFYPETVTRVDTCNFVLLSVLDYEQILEQRGVRELRTSQLELGALAQAAGLAATAHGAFLRPCRSFDADRLATLAGLSGAQTVSYLCLGGTSRFTDLLLDLRP